MRRPDPGLPKLLLSSDIARYGFRSLGHQELNDKIALVGGHQIIVVRKSVVDRSYRLGATDPLTRQHVWNAIGLDLRALFHSPFGP